MNKDVLYPWVDRCPKCGGKIQASKTATNYLTWNGEKEGGLWEDSNLGEDVVDFRVYCENDHGIDFHYFDFEKKKISPSDMCASCDGERGQHYQGCAERAEELTFEP